MTHLIRGNQILTQWPHVHTMPRAALLHGAWKRYSACEQQSHVEGILGTTLPSTHADFSIGMAMLLPAYILGLNTTNKEEQGQAGRVT